MKVNEAWIFSTIVYTRCVLRFSLTKKCWQWITTPRAEISRDRQIAQQSQLARPGVCPPYPNRSSTSQFLLPSRRSKLYHFKKKKRQWEPVTIACTGFLLLMLLGCGALGTGYYYYKTNIQPSLTSFERPVC